jgi:hypothetical protein
MREVDDVVVGEVERCSLRLGQGTASGCRQTFSTVIAI